MSASKITEYLLKFRPSEKWITESSGLPYLPLSLEVPWKAISAEFQGISENIVDHRPTDTYGPTKNVGWKSVTIYGISSSDTNNVSDNMGWTTVADNCPITVEWLKDYFVIDRTTGRIRFMLLAPDGFVILHKDRDYKKLSEVNIAINNPEECEFRFKNYGKVPFKNGTAFIMDTSNEHFVVNQSDTPRLHIIAHAKLKNDVISTSYANCYYS
jgi:hypothetical protein